MKNVVFIGNARCFHTIDWYHNANNILYPYKTPFLTDLIESEGYFRLVQSDDLIINLHNIDRYLFNTLSKFGDIWRNIVKLLFFLFR